MSIVAFLVVTPCYHVGGYRHFGGTYRLHLQGGRESGWECEAFI
jgi:hypothetical protein